MTGRVVSDRMDKTVVVVVETLRRHSLYAKVMRHRKRYKVHDEERVAHMGDMVRIEETRPLSREKRWCVVEVVACAKGSTVAAGQGQDEKAEGDDSELHKAEGSGQ